MPVVINEFEIVDAPPQVRPATGAETQQDKHNERMNRELLSPYTLARVLRHQKERLARVRAH
jgi:hypothetical protein